MTDQQKRGTALVATIALGALATFAVAMAVSAALGTFRGDEFLGGLFLRLSLGFAEINIMLKGLGVVVLAGAGYLGASCTSTREVAIAALLLSAGILASVVLFLLLKDAELAGQIWQRREPTFETPEAFLTAAQRLLSWTGGALVAGLVTFLGFSKKPSNA